MNQPVWLCKVLLVEMDYFHAMKMKAYGTKFVAGTSPGKGGTDVDNIPVFQYNV